VREETTMAVEDGGEAEGSVGGGGLMGLGAAKSGVEIGFWGGDGGGEFSSYRGGGRGVRPRLGSGWPAGSEGQHWMRFRGRGRLRRREVVPCVLDRAR
jgi:hypothetical protein